MRHDRVGRSRWRPHAEWIHRISSLLAWSSWNLSIVLLAVLSNLTTPTSARAQFVVTEGKGYVLCERLAAHVNRQTENGKAGRLWRRNVYPHVPQYPDKQRYLTRELLSFPGFTRPDFVEIKLEDIRGLIELMGEVDVFVHRLASPLYGGGPQNDARYFADRTAGRVPPELLDKLTPYGKRFYDRLAEGRARVFKSTGGDSPGSETLLQLEYADDETGELVALLRHVSNDLIEPRRESGGLDSAFPSRALVKWQHAYYSISTGLVDFKIDSLTLNTFPKQCWAENHYRPKEPHPQNQRN